MRGWVSSSIKLLFTSPLGSGLLQEFLDSFNVLVKIGNSFCWLGEQRFAMLHWVWCCKKTSLSSRPLAELCRQNQSYQSLQGKYSLQLLLELQDLSAGIFWSFISTHDIYYPSTCCVSSPVAQCCVILCPTHESFLNPCYFLGGVFVKWPRVFKSPRGPLDKSVTAFSLFGQPFSQLAWPRWDRTAMLTQRYRKGLRHEALMRWDDAVVSWGWNLHILLELTDKRQAELLCHLLCS